MKGRYFRQGCCNSTEWGYAGFQDAETDMGQNQRRHFKLVNKSIKQQAIIKKSSKHWGNMSEDQRKNRKELENKTLCTQLDLMMEQRKLTGICKGWWEMPVYVRRWAERVQINAEQLCGWVGQSRWWGNERNVEDWVWKMWMTAVNSKVGSNADCLKAICKIARRAANRQLAD